MRRCVDSTLRLPGSISLTMWGLCMRLGHINPMTNGPKTLGLTITTCIISHTLCSPGIWTHFSCIVMALGLSWCCSLVAAEARAVGCWGVGCWGNWGLARQLALLVQGQGLFRLAGLASAEHDLRWERRLLIFWLKPSRIFHWVQRKLHGPSWCSFRSH